MRIFLSLITLIVVTMLARAVSRPIVGASEAARIASISMTVGFVLIGAWLTGRLFDRWKLPKISGYLFFGVVFGPSMWALITGGAVPAWFDMLTGHTLPLITDQQVHGMHFAKDLAISLIAITAGGEIQLKWLTGQLTRVASLTFASVVIVGALIAAATTGLDAAFPIFGAEAPLSILETTIAISLLALIASGNSPSVAIALITELHADGPLSRTTLAVTVCKDLVIIVLFAALVAVGKGLLDEDTVISPHFMLAVGAELGGSIFIGMLSGLVMGWFVSHVEQHLVFFVVGACFLFALLGEQDMYMMVGGQEHHIHFHPLLVALAAGFVMRNFQPASSAPLFHTIEQMSLPVYCVFFAVAGAELNLEVFTVLATVVAVVSIVIVRAASIWAVISLTARVLRLEPQWSRKLWLCLTPQAGVTLALATLERNSFAGSLWAIGLHNLLLGMVAVHALIGPILYRWALVSAGEAGNADAQSEH